MRKRTASDFLQTPAPMVDLAAACFHALADPTRIRLLQAIRNGDKTVLDLVQLFEWSQPNISRHLSILATARLITRTKRGAQVYYAIADERIYELCNLICDHVEKSLLQSVRKR